MGTQAKARLLRRQLRMTQAEAVPERLPLPPWTPFEKATPYISPERKEALIADILKVCEEHGTPVPREQAEAMADEKQDAEMYQNSRYTVLLFRNEPARDGGPQMIHLSIRRNDRKRPGPERWRDFQRLKNELVGESHEGAELYPAETRVADCADQYHIYVLSDPTFEFPFGFRDGMKAGPSVDGPAVQTPFED